MNKTIENKIDTFLAENPELYWENPKEIELIRECRRLGIDPFDSDEDNDNCPDCGAELDEFKGMVGEQHIVCSSRCGWEWCDERGAIAAVL